MYDTLKESPIGKKLLAAGFEIMNTGGGCMAWGRDTSYRTLILIGQGDGDLGEDGNEEKWGTCVTREDGDYLEQHTKTGTLEECIAAMAQLDLPETKMPKVGDRVMFRSPWDIFPCDLIIGEGEFGTVTTADSGTIYVRMDDEFPNLKDWNNEVEMGADNADLNGFSFAGWLLHHLTVFETAEQESETELGRLTAEYTAWNTAQGLDLGSADEHQFDEALTEDQRVWVRDFVERWEYAATFYGKDGCDTRRRQDARLALLIKEGA